MTRQHYDYDAVIVGSGPNGLAAAITLGQAGLSVLLLEGKETLGGGTRTEELTLPGYLHDVCSTAHPLGLASPFFRDLPLDKYGLEWVQPDLPVAHPLDGGRAAVIERSVAATASRLGADGPAYTRLMSPLVERWEDILDDMLGPLPLPPRHPFTLARFGLTSLLPAATLAKGRFKTDAARALFAGVAAHSILPLTSIVTSGFGLMLGVMAHAVGWPFVRGGSQNLTDALAAMIREQGGEIQTGHFVNCLNELPPARATLLDVTPRQLLSIAGDQLPAGYRSRLNRYRYGPGVFKVDWALSGPVPWTAPECRRAGTVHIGGTLDEVVASEGAVWRGEVSQKPVILLTQPTLFDRSRAPDGGQIVWAYCHVPNGSTIDMTGYIEAQIERFAPGFRDCIQARSVKTPADMQAHNPNYVGGDIIGGVQDLGQFFTRPVVRWDPYSTPVKGLYLCSSSTPPGGGVHGMCGYHAARSALKKLR